MIAFRVRRIESLPGSTRGGATLSWQSETLHDWAAVIDSRGELIGGRYRVTSLLGQGGMGTVYAAVDAVSGTPVAVKRLRSAANTSTLELFKREFHTLRGLRHPNIITVYDYASDAGGPFYTMELLEGSDLGEAAPLSFRVVCRYLRQIADVLGVLHARRLLHRDISPRNIWIFPDGRLKLIDFGALSPFGIPNEVVGTLPLLAPEWLAHRSAGIRVDQRADLYSLGALGYWLLTGQHAYQTHAGEDVARSWAQPPPPPSAWIQILQDPVLEAIPAELDALILALLQPDVATRPESTERVIDRIDAIVKPAHSQSQGSGAMHGWLHSLAFVGRSYEQQLFQRLLAGGRETNSLAIEADPGMGRSRLLEELSVVATLSSTASVLVRGEERERSYALAEAIALGLSDQMLSQARAAAEPCGAVLAQLSPELRRRLELPAPVATERTRLQQALTQWLQLLAAERRIVILVDDIERADEESVAWLTALERQVSPERVLLVRSTARNAQVPLPLELFGRAAQRVALAPLSAREVELLLHSAFGPVDYVNRVAHAVYRVSLGNPAHCVELLEHLVESGVVRYVDGAWILPGLLEESELPRARADLHLARFRNLSERAQHLAQLLSVHDGQLTRAHFGALSDLSDADTAAALVQLVLAGVLIESDQGYGFVHPAVREHALAMLSRSAREQAHARFAEWLLSTSHDPVDELRAGLHLWHAGDTRRCQRLVSAASRQLTERSQRTWFAVELLEQIVALYRSANCHPRALAAPLAALAVAGYAIDSRLAQRYGDFTLELFEKLFHFGLARKLRLYVGAKPALYAALAVAALEHRTELEDLVFMFLAGANSLNGVAVSIFDHALGRRCVRALDPFEALGGGHIAGLLYWATRAMASMTSTENPAATLAELRAFSAHTASGTPIRGLADDFRNYIVLAASYPIGVLEWLRMNPVALEYADRIDSGPTLDIVGADQLRAVFHSMRGDRARAAEYMRRVETRALQAGTAWQIVMLGPYDAHFTALWTHDALLGKHAAVELERISHELPTVRPFARRARAIYLVLCGRYREAIDTLRDPGPRMMGWTLAQTIVARAHNKLGEHERARDLCREALEGRDQETLDFVVLFLHAQLELALAEAALGDYDSATARTQHLLERHRDIGPLALGAIHETCARAALLEGATEVARRHYKFMRRHYLSTESASLYELSSQLGEHIAAQVDGGVRPAITNANRLAWLGDDAELTTRAELSRVRNESAWRERAKRGLQIVHELTDAASAFILASRKRQEVISLDTESLPDEVIEWAEVIRAGGPQLTAEFPPGEPAAAIATHQLGDQAYCLLPIGPTCDAPAVPAVLVLAFPSSGPAIPEPSMLTAVARSLRGMLAQA